MISKKEVWVIMSRDRKVIAKGTPRNRYLVETADESDTKRLLTYSSEGRARAGFSGGCYFYTHRLPKEIQDQYRDSNSLEAVKVEMIIQEVK